MTHTTGTGGADWRRPRVARYLHAVFALYAVLVLVSMLAPLPAPSSVPHGADKLVHLAAFIGLGALWYWAGSSGRGGASAGWVMAGSAAMAAAVEVVQALLPYRTGELWDFAVGAVGGVVGVVVARRLLRGSSFTDRQDGQTACG